MTVPFAIIWLHALICKKQTRRRITPDTMHQMYLSWFYLMETWYKALVRKTIQAPMAGSAAQTGSIFPLPARLNSIKSHYELAHSAIIRWPFHSNQAQISKNIKIKLPIS